MVRRDPFGVVSRGRSDSRAICSTRDLHRAIGLLRTGSGLFVTPFSAPALLGKVRRNPDRVEEVHNTAEASQKEEVQEDTVSKTDVSN